MLTRNRPEFSANDRVVATKDGTDRHSGIRERNTNGAHVNIYDYGVGDIGTVTIVDADGISIQFDNGIMIQRCSQYNFRKLQEPLTSEEVALSKKWATRGAI